MARLGKWQWGLLASRAVAALLAASAPASAGGFAVREQSTEFQGMSFAGHGAAGGGLSAMFWNPAAAAYAPVGIYTEAHYAVIVGNSEITAGPGTTPALLLLDNKSGDIAKDAIVPSSYMSYRLSDRLVAAISVNSPFGLVTEPPHRDWAGRTLARTNEIKTYNFAPTLAYRLTPAIAIGVGLQIQHIEARLKQGVPFFPGVPNNVVQGDDTAFGFTAGINFSPSERTHIGLGYRSSIDHTLEGTRFIAGLPIAAASIKAGTTLPEIVTLSIRQALTDRLTLLGSLEWTHWSRLEKLDVVCTQTPAAMCPGGHGSLISSLPLGWHDGWLVALGGEYRHSHALTLRAGLAYEKSPIQNATERILSLPDADRIWASVGATYKWSDKIALDFAYTHIFVDEAAVDREITFVPPGLTHRVVGHSESSVDIVSASLKIKLGGEPAPAPLK